MVDDGEESTKTNRRGSIFQRVGKRMSTTGEGKLEGKLQAREMAMRKGSVTYEHMFTDPVGAYKAMKQLKTDENSGMMTGQEAEAYARKVEKDFMARVTKDEKKAYGKGGYHIQKTTITDKVDNLFRACKRGSPVEVRHALLDGADIDSKDSMGNTPLHYATIGGYLPTIYTLLSYDANPNIQNNHGSTPLIYTAQHNFVEAARQLLAAKAKREIPTFNGNTALHISAEKGHMGVTELYLQGQPSDSEGENYISALKPSVINHKDKFGQTACHKAALANQPVICELLINMGADQSMEDNDCRKPSDICRMMGNKEAGRALDAFQTQAALSAANRRQMGSKSASTNKDLRRALSRMHRQRQQEGGMNKRI
jgi:ankyrin repeat protein